MKHILLFFSVALFTSAAFAQVGINTEDPQAMLDIVAGATPSEKDGLLIPRIDEYPTGVTAAQDGMLVFITGNGATAKGFYYYDHTTTSWNAVQGESDGWSLTGNAPSTSSSFIGTTNNEYLRFKTDDIEQMVLDNNGHLGINNSSPNAILDLGVTSGTNVIEAFANGSPGGATSFDQINTGGAESVLINSGVSQTFIPSISGDLISFRIYCSDSDTGSQSVNIRIVRESGGSLINQNRNISFPNSRSQVNIDFSPGQVSLIAGQAYRFEIRDNEFGFIDYKINIFYSSTSTYENGAASGNVPSGDIAFLTVMQTASTPSGTKLVLDDIGQLSLGHDNPTATLDVQGTFKYETGGEGQGRVLKSDANGIAFWQDEVVNTDNQQIDVLSLNGTDLEISLQDDGIATQTLDLSSLQDGTGTDNQQIDVLNLNGTNLEISLQDDGVATQTLDLVSLQDGTGTDNQQIDVLNLNGTNLEISLQDDGVATQMLDLSSLQDGTGTDNQQIDVLNLNGTDLEISLQDDGIVTQTLDLSSLQDGTGTDDQQIDVLNLNGTNLEISLQDDGVATQTLDLASLQDGSGGTLDEAYDFGGPGGGRVINATSGALSVLGLDGIIVRGTFGDGTTITASGSGPRMLFNPRKAAFRAGNVSSTQWNDANVGEFSAAFGFSTIASASRATAFGFQTTASETDATSFGNNTTASGISATAFGNNTEASGSNALAFGVNTEASGSESIASGTGTIASGDRATAFGSSTTASGGLATSFGLGTNASGGRATAFGRFTTASASEATAFGFQTEASGVQATAFGNDTTASGENATAFGDRSIAVGENATAFGTISRAQGDHSIAVGSNARANGIASFAQGSGTLATGFASTALGFGTRAVSNNETALGRFNELTASDRNFVVGNGISDLSRSNAFEVFNSGLVRINDSYSLPVTDGTNGQAMITDGVGNLSFQNVTSTLDQAYDSGGAGAGRTINVDNGAVVIQGNAGGATATTSAQLILTETQANDFSRIRLTNSVETDNIWTIATRTDNDAASSRMNFNHTGAGDMFQLFGDNTIEMETYVGVNQANPDHAIHLPNNAFNNVGTGLAFAWDTYSDKRIKSQFKSIENALELLIKTKPTRYKQHNSSFKNGSLFIKKSGTNTLGFIAQELYEVLPEAVNKPEDETKALWSVNYDKVIPVAVKAIQELKAEKDALAAQVQALETKLASFEGLEARLQALENKEDPISSTLISEKK